MPPKKHRILQWGSGYTEIRTLQHLLMSPTLELVGLKCFTPDKQGRDADEIAGRGIGVVSGYAFKARP